MQQQVVEEITKWQQFQLMETTEQIHTALLIGSPAIVAVLGTIFMIASMRKIFVLDDKHVFLYGIAMSGLLGVASLYSLRGIIHGLIGFDFYIQPECYVAALVLTPIANHIVFKIIIVMLFVMYSYGKNPDALLKWLPYKQLAKALYKLLTQKELVQKVINEAGDEEDVTRFGL
jgi:hypothetical protein